MQTFGTPIVTSPPLTHLFPSPEVLAEADVARIGLPRKRAETIRALARAVSEGRIAFSSVDNTEEFQSRLREIPGIGDWTVQYIAMRALGDPDALPASDLGLLRSASFDHERELAQRAEAWRPWRAYAAMHFWQGTEEAEREERSPRGRTQTFVRTALSRGKVARASRP